MSEELAGAFRLSPQQERLWRLQQHTGSHQHYRAQGAVLIEGDLDAFNLEVALTDVIERHQVLRTTFHHLPGIVSAVQAVADSQPVGLPVKDLSDLQPDEQTARLEAIWKETLQVPFDLQQPTAIQASLHKLAEQKHMLLLALPSLCADRLALDNLIHEISRSYASHKKGVKPDDDVMEYLVFSEWQNELLESEDAELGKDFWSRQEWASVPQLRLPFERFDDDSQELVWQNIQKEIPSSLMEAVKATAQQYDTSVQAFLLACWQILLGRLSQQSDITIGVNFNGRSDEELILALGLFEKYLPIQSNLEGHKRFHNLLIEVDESVRNAQDWQECFTWNSVRAGNGQEDKIRLIPYGFEFVKHPTPHIIDEITFSFHSWDAQTDYFKMKLSVVHKGNQFVTEFSFDAARLTSENVDQISQQYYRLLESAAKSPEAAIGALDIVTEQERQQLLIDFNDTRNELPGDHRLHSLFEMQVARTPHDIAIEYADQRLTYSELNARANQLAAYLRQHGVGPESLVGLFVERSVEMMVGLLGILKAGGAYVPIDPSYPKDRISFILQDAQPVMLLTQSHLSEALHDQTVPIYHLDSDWQTLVNESTENFESGNNPDNLAYVIYTSGSTGKPKGVMITHRAICNRLLWMQATFPLQVGSRLLQKTSISFDASVWELFVPLFSGATLVIAQPGGHQDSSYLVRVIIERSITVLQLVPSMLQVLLEEPGVQNCTSLRDVFCGGEALPAELQTQFYRLLKANLHNLYGPTEVSIDATFWNCQTDPGTSVVPIGKPLDNVQVYLLNAHQQLVPVGLAGEIYIGGAGLARGYLNRPDLSAERFIPNPFSEVPGSRLYKTGDLARHLPDGTIEFSGRVDHQVKLRGFRIELGEIETTLEEHELVNRAVVIVQDSHSPLQRLVAYVVAQTVEAVSSHDLRSFLEEKLPEYMVPSAIVFLDKFPLTPNGKLDRQALPRLEDSRTGISETFVAPRNATEELLAGMWAEILKVEQVGVYDNFFELGGHSLLAVRINSRIHSAFQVEVPLNQLFEYPTVAALSSLIDSLAKTEGKEAEEPIQPVDRNSDLPLSFAQQRLWFLYEMDPENAVYNIPVAVHLSGKLSVDALKQAIEEIVSRHEVLRTSYSAMNGRRVQTIHSVARLDIQVENLESGIEEERWEKAYKIAKQEAARPFDLEKGLPVRARLLRLSKQQHVLLFTMHHIASDAWSMNIVVKEFAALYSAFQAGKPSPLSELKIQYADFAVWQRNHLTGELLDAQMEYWKQQLANCSTMLELPTDRPRPMAQTFKGAKEPFSITTSLYQEVLNLSRREDATLFMTLLAALQVVLHYHSKQDDINIGSNIAGRTRLETEELIGFFINLLVMRTKLTDNPSFHELLARVRETAIGAFAHQDIPFDKLVEELQPPRAPNSMPLVQVVFDFVSNPTSTPELPGLDLRILSLSDHVGKFDLVLNIEVREHGLEGALQYKTDLFESSTAARILKHFEVVLQKAVENPDITLSELKESLAEYDRQLQLAERAEFKEKRQKMMRQARQKDNSGIVA